nr:uncharacterized protein LOC116278047 [Vicugna pacos]
MVEEQHQSFSSSFTERAEVSSWSSLQTLVREEHLEAEKHPDLSRKRLPNISGTCLGKVLGHQPYLFFLGRECSFLSMFLPAQGRASKSLPQLLHCSDMSLVPVLVLMTLFALRGAGAQSVTQPDRHGITVPEGARLELRCNYSSTYSPSLFWYVQYPNQGPQLLLKYVSGNSFVSGIKGFMAEFRRNETSFHLKKTSAHWSDSAEYFCVLGDTVPESSGEAEHKLCDSLRTISASERFWILTEQKS